MTPSVGALSLTITGGYSYLEAENEMEIEMKRASYAELVVFLLVVSFHRTHGQPDPRWDLHPDSAKKIVRFVVAGADVTPANWPEGKRVAVALTFDFDAELVWMHDPSALSPTTASRGQYSARAGLPRILSLLRKNNTPATFFFPALMLELYPDAVNAIRANNEHGIGYHGYAHENVRSLTEAQERDALRRGVALFREKGITPIVFRSPSWNFSPSTLKLLREFGFRFDSSLMGDDRPYEILQDSLPSGIIEFPVDWSLDDWPYFQLDWSASWQGLRDPEEVFRIWKAEFDGIRNDGGLFLLTMHPQVIGRWNRLQMLERLIDYMQSKGDVWFATLGAIGNYVGQGVKTPGKNSDF